MSAHLALTALVVHDYDEAVDFCTRASALSSKSRLARDARHRTSPRCRNT